MFAVNISRSTPPLIPTIMSTHRSSLLIGLLIVIPLFMMGCSSDDTQSDATFTYDFPVDSEGWIAGFADLPANYEPSLYELSSSYQKLPSGLPGYGLYIQGHNRSDDLFMFFIQRC